MYVFPRLCHPVGKQVAKDWRIFGMDAIFFFVPGMAFKFNTTAGFVARIPHRPRRPFGPRPIRTALHAVG